METNNPSDKILQAAQEEFAKKGFHDTAVSEIADKANVGKGTVYRHFGNKETLFGTLLKRGIHRILDQTENIAENSDSASQALEQILEMHFQIFEESKELVEIIVNEGKHRIGTMREELLSEDLKHRQQIEDQFIRGINRGEFEDLDPEKMAIVFQGFIWATLRSAILYGEMNLRRDYSGLVSKIFFKGIE